MKNNLVIEIDDNDLDNNDCLDTCTYCGEKYDPDEGHTEIDENEEETGNYFCSPECEYHHSIGGDWHSHK